MQGLIIIRGNSGSGKSSAAKELQRRFGENTMLISQDAVRRDMLMTRDGRNTHALSLLITLLRYGRENCAEVILEGILNSGWYSELFDEAVRLYGNNIGAYYYDLTFEETLRRHETKPNHLDFGESDMRRWWKDKDLIGTIPEKMITAEFSLAETADMIYREAIWEKDSESFGISK